MYFAGSFYDNNCKKLKDFFNSSDIINPKFKKVKSAVIPHAGYIYSGKTALEAFKIIDFEDYERIIVVGPSHHIYFNGISILNENLYETPCGYLNVDNDYSSFIINKFNHFTSYFKQAHREHSTEVMMPFINHYAPDKKIIEVVYGNVKYDNLLELLEYFTKKDENLLIISTDLSHFYNIEKAEKLDKNCIKAFKESDISYLERCEACGMLGIKAIIEISKLRDFKPKFLRYDTSAQTNGNYSEVVGYMSGIFIK